MPIYFTSQGIAFSENGEQPSVFVRYDNIERALTLVDNSNQVLLGDLDSPELETIVRNTLGNFAVLTQPVEPVQAIESKIRITNAETDSFVTEGGIEAQYIRITSDKDLKTNLKELPSFESKQVLNDFRPYLYQYRDGANFHAGVLAQDLQKHELTKLFVSQGIKGNLTVDFVSHLYCLVHALTEEVFELKNKVRNLERESQKKMDS